MSDRRGTDASLVGEGRTLEADDDHAEHTTGDALWVESTVEDGTEGRRDILDVETDDDQPSTHVDERHRRHELRGDLADGLDASDDDQGDQRGKYKTEDECCEVRTERTVLTSGDRADLGEGLVRLEHPPPTTPKSMIATANRPVMMATGIRPSLRKATFRYWNGPPWTTPFSSM